MDYHMIYGLKNCLVQQMIKGKYFQPNRMMDEKETKNEMNWLVYITIQHVYIFFKTMHHFLF